MTTLFPASFVSMEEAGRDAAHLSDTESSSSGGQKKKPFWSACSKAVGSQCGDGSWSILFWWLKGSSSTLMARLLRKAFKFFAYSCNTWSGLKIWRSGAPPHHRNSILKIPK